MIMRFSEEMREIFTKRSDCQPVCGNGAIRFAKKNWENPAYAASRQEKENANYRRILAARILYRQAIKPVNGRCREATSCKWSMPRS